VALNFASPPRRVNYPPPRFSFSSSSWPSLINVDLRDCCRGRPRNEMWNANAGNEWRPKLGYARLRPRLNEHARGSIIFRESWPGKERGTRYDFLANVSGANLPSDIGALSSGMILSLFLPDPSGMIPLFEQDRLYPPGWDCNYLLSSPHLLHESRTVSSARPHKRRLIS
jgi:hypothetical protein